MIYLELRDGFGLSNDLAGRVNPEGPIFGPFRVVSIDKGIIKVEKDDEFGILYPHQGRYYYDGEWYTSWKVWEDKRMRKLPSLRDRCMKFVQQYAVLPKHIMEERMARIVKR